VDTEGRVVEALEGVEIERWRAACARRGQTCGTGIAVDGEIISGENAVSGTALGNKDR